MSSVNLPSLALEQAATAIANEPSRANRLRLLADQIDVQEKYEMNAKALLEGRLMTATELAHAVNARLGTQRYSAIVLNKALTYRGYQTCHVIGKTKTQIYCASDKAIENQLAKNNSYGTYLVARWSERMVDVICDGWKL